LRLAFFVNDVATEIPEYTTTRLALAATRLGHEVWYVGAGNLRYGPAGDLGAHAYPATGEEGDDLASFLDRVQGGVPSYLALDEADAVMLRNDSIEDLHERPWAFTAGILFGRMLAESGVCVVNDPAQLSHTGSKLYLQEFPEGVRPRGLISREREEIRSFVAETGRSVIKPLYGAKGRNVFLVEDETDPNLNQIIEAVLQDGYVLAQEQARGAEEGDVRFFLLDGEPLEEDGSYAAFRRVPEDHDIRANISAGGHPQAVDVHEGYLQMISEMTERLRKDGMFFVGIDIVGDKVVEINVESAGGLQSVEHFTGIDFAPKIIHALEDRALRKSRSPSLGSTE
jgi:glutathione synthase